MRNFKKVRIINCVARKNEGRFVQKLLERKAEDTEISIAYDSEMGGAWKTYRMAMDIEDDSDFLVIMEDDLSFPIDVLQRIDYVLNSAPRDAWVFFYVPTNRDMQQAIEGGNHVLKAQCNFWTQCTAIPREGRKNILRDIDKIWPATSKSSDGRMMRYFCDNNIYAYTILPSLFQHLGTWRSSLGYNGKVGKYVRNSFCYSPDFNVYEIDWEKEFKTPYIDKQQRALGFKGWSEGMPTDIYNDGGFKK